MNSKILCLLIFMSCIFLKVSPSYGQTKWKGTVSSDWATAANWTAGVPTSTTDVIIGDVSFTGTFQPSIAIAASAKSIVLGDNTKVSQLSVGNTLSLPGNITIGTKGTLDANSQVTCVNITVKSTGLLKVNAAVFTWNYSISTLILNAGSIVEYSSTLVDQVVSSSFAYSTLRISGTGTRKSLAADLPALQSASGTGVIDVRSGIFDLSTFQADRGTIQAGGLLNVSNGAFLKIGGANNFPENYSTKTLLAGSTTEYNGGNQSVSLQHYGNLILSSSANDVVKTMPSVDFIVGGSLTSKRGSGTSVFYAAASNISVIGSVNIEESTTFDGATFSHTVTGIWNNQGFFTSSTSTIILTGGSTGISGNLVQNFYDLTVSGTVNLQNVETIEVRNLLISPQINISLILAHAIVKIGGSITSSGNFVANDGTIELNGTTAQTIFPNTFLGNAVDNLVISNSSTDGVTLNGAVDVYRSLIYSGAGTNLATNDFLTLKSTASGTAWIGNMTGRTISGAVTVERYLAGRKAWRFLSVPTNTSQTVNASWQEGSNNTSDNFLPGSGTQITSNRPLWAPEGFDIQSQFPSMKWYESLTNTWIGIENTNVAGIKTTSGYMIFIRGDRTVNAVATDPTETVLRTQGNLYTGDRDAINVAPDLFVAIGNPYAAPLDMRNIIKPGVKNFFYVWDPQLTGNYGFGGYQTFSLNEDGDYEITPGDGTYHEGGSVWNFIGSGMAFLVQGGSTGGNLVFTEDAKTDGLIQSSLTARPQRTELRASLYGVKAGDSAYMIDGILNSYSDNYSNVVNNMDGVKLNNGAENLAIRSGDKLLAIERRHSITEKDTLFLNLANAKLKKYRFKFTATGLGRQGLTGFLEDNYLHTRIPLDLNGSTLVDFIIVNNAASYAQDRFRIVFKPAVVLDCKFILVKAYRKNKDITVEWKVGNETGIKKYAIEESEDGKQFTKLSVVTSGHSQGPSVNYQVTDTHSVYGYNYYRIKTIDVYDRTEYSAVVKVLMEKEKQGITIYPNPVIDNYLSIRLDNMPPGKYIARLLDNGGRKVIEKIIQHNTGSSTDLIAINKTLPYGTYQLQVIKPGNKIFTNKLIHW